jgi:hypothetical protein
LNFFKFKNKSLVSSFWWAVHFTYWQWKRFWWFTVIKELQELWSKFKIINKILRIVSWRIWPRFGKYAEDLAERCQLHAVDTTSFSYWETDPLTLV